MRNSKSVLILFSSVLALNAKAQTTSIGGAFQYRPATPAAAQTNKNYVVMEATAPALTTAVYQLNGNAPFWTVSRENLARAAAFMRYLPEIRRHGLQPHDYRFERLFASLRGNEADFELRFTNEVLRLLSDLQVGRVAPSSVSNDIHFETRKFTNAQGAYNFIMNISNTTFDALAPQHQRYQNLMSILQTLRDYNARGGYGPLGQVPTEYKMGVTDPLVLDIKERLNVFGYNLYRDTHYDAETFQAMKEIQRASLVEDTGNLNSRSKGTWAFFAVDSRARQLQVELTMEKLRWLPANLGERYILVNIANQEVQVVDPSLDATSPVRLRRAITGKPNHRTPSMTDRVVNVALNPKWRVTENILKNELAPKLIARYQKDGIDGITQYLDRSNMKLVDRNDRTVELDPTTIDWGSVDPAKTPFMMVQDSGLDNALGVVKINLANKLSIYMHDTDDRSLFDRFRRLLSHGCIRIQDPLELAAYLLEGSRAALTVSELENEVSTAGVAKDERIVPIAQNRKLPVYILPLTVYMRNNHPTFTPDVYDQNRDLYNALTRNGYYRPENMPTAMP